jgi:hypothetical protein
MPCVNHKIIVVFGLHAMSQSQDNCCVLFKSWTTIKVGVVQVCRKATIVDIK